MKNFHFLTVLGISLLPLAFAQSSIDTGPNIPLLPSCASQCLINSITSTSCFSYDTKCLCESQGYIDALTPCVRVACDGDALKQAEEYAVQACAAVGVEVTIPLQSSSVTSVESSSTPTPSTNSETTTTDTSATETETSSSSRTSSSPTSTSGTSTSKPQNSDDDQATTTNESSSSQSNGGGSSTNIGAIVGGVVGGVAAIALVLVAVWLLLRERRKKAAAAAAGHGMPPPSNPPMQPDPNSQSIWTGDNAYSWNPQTNTNDVNGGVQSDGRY